MEDREDFLTEDSDVPGQKFCLLSFLSPEKVLANKDMFLFEKFLTNFELSFRVKTFETFLMSTIKEVNDKLNAESDKADEKDLSGAAQVLRDSRVRVDTIMDGLQTYFKNAQADLKASTLKTAYDDFLFTNRTKLEDEFFSKNDFRTTVRGVKVRGSYNSKEEAVARSKKLQRMDPLHNIYVADVGKWLPWDPEPSEISEQEYAEDKLNTLMKKYKENEEARDMFERENRAKANGNQGSKKKVVGITREDSEAPEGASEEYHSMFGTSGHADLAMARKMENSVE
jgi:hypothetical protein